MKLQRRNRKLFDWIVAIESVRTDEMTNRIIRSMEIVSHISAPGWVSIGDLRRLITEKGNKILQESHVTTYKLELRLDELSHEVAFAQERLSQGDQSRWTPAGVRTLENDFRTAQTEFRDLPNPFYRTPEFRRIRPVRHEKISRRLDHLIDLGFVTKEHEGVRPRYTLTTRYFEYDSLVDNLRALKAFTIARIDWSDHARPSRKVPHAAFVLYPKGETSAGRADAYYPPVTEVEVVSDYLRPIVLGLALAGGKLEERLPGGFVLIFHSGKAAERNGIRLAEDIESTGSEAWPPSVLDGLDGSLGP